MYFNLTIVYGSIKNDYMIWMDKWTDRQTEEAEEEDFDHP